MIFSATMLRQNLLPNALTIFCTIFALQVFEEALKLATTSYELRVSYNIRVVNFLRDAFCVPFSLPLLRQKTSRVTRPFTTDHACTIVLRYNIS